MTPLPTETECRPIEGFPHYAIGIDGSVWSCRTRGGRMLAAYQKMTPELRKNGRLYIGLRRDGKLNPRLIHRLVLEAFVGLPPEGCVGCHCDGDPLNNHASNLRWDTQKENLADRYEHGTHFVGERNPAARLTAEKAAEIRRLCSEGMMQKDVAPMFGVSKQTVQAIVAGKIWNSDAPKKRRKAKVAK